MEEPAYEATVEGILRSLIGLPTHVTKVALVLLSFKLR